VSRLQAYDGTGGAEVADVSPVYLPEALALGVNDYGIIAEHQSAQTLLSRNTNVDEEGDGDVCYDYVMDGFQNGDDGTGEPSSRTVSPSHWSANAGTFWKIVQQLARRYVV